MTAKPGRTAASAPPIDVTCADPACGNTWSTRTQDKGHSQCPVCKRSKHVIRPRPPRPERAKPPRSAEMSAADVFELAAIERRVPEGSQGAEDTTAGLLDGILLDTPVRLDWESEDAALAVLAVRKRWLRHPCSSRPVTDPGCEHPDHPRDVAIIRGFLDTLGLPSGTELIPLADEIQRQEQERGNEP
jgi:hypothetical protein